MKRCTQCLIPDTRPDTAFVNGVCSACISYASRPAIDWEGRLRQLAELLDRHHGECIVPSSGGKDSTYQVVQLLKMGARPTVVTATTCMLTDIGRRNISNLPKLAQTIEYTPNMTQRANLNRLGLEMVGDISWPEHVAIFTVPFRAACDLRTPLIFYGENPQNQYGGPPGADQAREMTRRWVSEFGGFLGLRPSDLRTMGYDMSYYTAPGTADLERCGIEAHFLGQYIPWDSHSNADSAILNGMRFPPEGPTPANWWPWENLDNAMTGIHDHFMFRKYGYGRGAAQISVDVRSGLISREEALAWVREHDGQFPDHYMDVPYLRVLDQIGVSATRFAEIMEEFTDWRLFEKAVNGLQLKCSPSE